MSVFAIKQSLTLPDVLRLLASQLSTPSAVPVTIPFPEMKGGEDHKLYALLIQAGESHKQACALAGVKSRTAHGWRSDLRQAVSVYIGREVEYEFASRFVMDPDLRRICQVPRP